VLRALRRRLPAEKFLYLGDTARLPYGTKTSTTVERYALQAVGELAHRDVKAVVVACNTASAAALPALMAAHADLPLIGVIEPGAEAAVAASVSGRIGVLATESTVQGGAYPRAIHRRRPEAQVRSVPASLFVALAEEGWTEGAIAEAVARAYLAPLFADAAHAPDTLVLGCTHFPPLRAAIETALPRPLQIVDSAETSARALEQLLRGRELAATQGAGGSDFLVTDGVERFLRTGPRFLGEEIAATQVERIDLGAR
jgi:glutamate racemase